MQLCKSLQSSNHQVKQIILFEDFHGNDSNKSLSVQAAEKATASALVEASFGLESLCASFVSDASGFFDTASQSRLPKSQFFTNNHLLQAAIPRSNLKYPSPG